MGQSIGFIILGIVGCISTCFTMKQFMVRAAQDTSIDRATTRRIRQNAYPVLLLTLLACLACSAYGIYNLVA